MSTSNDALTALVTTAMMTALDQEKRDELIRKALEALVAKPETSFGRTPQPSQLQQAFNDAVYNTAKQVVAEQLNTDEVRQQVRTLVADAFDKMMVDRDTLAAKMASAIVDAMRGR